MTHATWCSCVSLLFACLPPAGLSGLNMKDRVPDDKCGWYKASGGPELKGGVAGVFVHLVHDCWARLWLLPLVVLVRSSSVTARLSVSAVAGPAAV